MNGRTGALPPLGDDEGEESKRVRSLHERNTADLMASYNQSPLATGDDRQQINLTRVTNPSKTIDYSQGEEETVVIHSKQETSPDRQDLTINNQVKNETKTNK